MNRFALSLTVLMAAASLSAYEPERAQRWEFYLGPQYIEGKNIDFGNDAEADINDMASLMFGFGYNFDNRFNLGMAFSSASANYRGSAVCAEGSSGCTPGTKETFTSTMYSSALNVTGTYNFLEGNFTPFIQANLGMTYIDSGISTGQVVDGCYWLPWWGYVCSPYDLTYTGTRFNYGAQAGLRYDFSNGMFLRGGVGINYIDISHADNPAFTVYNFGVGFLFD